MTETINGRTLHGLALTAAIAAALAFAAPTAAQSPQGGAKNPSADSGDGAAGHSAKGPKPGEASGPDEPQTHLKPDLPPIHLSAGQQQQVRAALAEQHTEVTFQQKGTKPLKNFQPAVGAKVPAKMPEHALPSDLTQKLPQLADYKYVKVKGQVLIVNPMTHKIVDMFAGQG